MQKIYIFLCLIICCQTHPSIFWRLSGFGRSKHRSPDSLIGIISDHGRLFQLIWRETEGRLRVLRLAWGLPVWYAQNTSTGFFWCGRAAAVLRVPLQWPNSHSLMLLKRFWILMVTNPGLTINTYIHSFTFKALYDTVLSQITIILTIVSPCKEWHVLLQHAAWKKWWPHFALCYTASSTSCAPKVTLILE